MSAIWPGGLLSAYLTVTGVVLLVGAGRRDPVAIALHLALLALAALVTWRREAPEWARLWIPVIAIPLLYGEMPSIIAAAGHVGVFDARVLAWELSIFGGSPSSDWAAAWRSTLFSELLHLCYLAYYPIVASVPLLLFIRGRRREMPAAVFALLLTFVFCFVAFAVFPVEGPRYRGLNTAPDGPIRLFTLALLEGGSSRGTAFPSSHVAASVAQCVIAMRFFGRRGAMLAIPTLGLASGAVYGGFHYGVDATCGAVLGAGVAVLGLWIARVVARQTNATAPT